jgi:hypothetical protein
VGERIGEVLCLL